MDSFVAELILPFFKCKVLAFDDVVRVGTCLSLLELEFWESDRAFSPFVDDEDSLLDLKVRLSTGMTARIMLEASKDKEGNERRFGNVTRH